MKEAILRGQQLGLLTGRRYKPPLYEQAGMTAGQYEVLRQLARGRNPGAIAKALNIGPIRVRTMIHSLLRALGAKTREEAIAFARRKALL